MNTKDSTVTVEYVACSMCMKEIPTSEAVVPEATDYLMHFCGLTCYDQWKKQADKSVGTVKAPRT